MGPKQKKVILVSNGNLASMIALKDWLKKDLSLLQAVYITTRLPSAKNNFQGLLNLYINCGFRYTFFKVWINLIAPIILKVTGHPHSVTKLLKECDFKGPIRHVVSVNDPVVINDMKKLEADTLVSFSAAHRFSNEVLSLYSDTSVNVHYGTLPRFAGLSPYFWHLYEQEEMYGVTLHNISEQLDAGTIIAQPRCLIGSKDALGLLIEMSKSVSHLLIEYFERTDVDKNSVQQDLKARTYYGHPTKKQVKLFFENGYRFSTRDSRAQFLFLARKN